MAGDGVTPTQLQTTMLKGLLDGPRTATSFYTNGELVSANSARHCLRRMEDHEWVRRLWNDRNYRSAKWEITALGKQVIRHR